MSFGRFQFRRGTATEWATSNPILAEGEIGLELNTKKIKIGDGTTAWEDLPYGGISGPEASGHLHVQVNDSTVWTVQHQLGFYPGGISVFDEDGTLLLGWNAQHSTPNILILTFPSPCSGTVYVS